VLIAANLEELNVLQEFKYPETVDWLTMANCRIEV
jgi:hypothetical protein